MSFKDFYRTRSLFEDVFKYHDLSPEERDDIYNVFKQSYEKSLGTSWDYSKFQGRTRNWLFFGDKEGFVTVRPQRSGLYKLTGVGGKLSSIKQGLEELKSTGNPVWGMADERISGILRRKFGFSTPPVFVLKMLLKIIPKGVFGGADFDINDDGSLTLHYSDVGDAKKYFIANKQYYLELLKMMGSQAIKIPKIAEFGMRTFINKLV